MTGTLALALLVAVLAVRAGTANAAGQQQILSFDAGLSDYQAGSHPDAFVSFRLATEPGPVPGIGELGQCSESPDTRCHVVKGGPPKDVVVELPRGVFGNPRTIPQCTLPELSEPNEKGCPVASQVGYQELRLIIIGRPPAIGVSTPIYNMVPERGEVAKFGFRVLNAVNSFISVKVRSNGDYGLTTTVANVFTAFPLAGTDLTIWGDPYDASHDAQRMCANGETFGCAAEVPRKPFMVAPAECGVPGSATLRVRSWSHPGDDDWSAATSTPQQVHGCEKLSFRPTFDLRPTAPAPDSSTGLDVELGFPQQFDNVSGLEAPPLKDARVTLPEGMAINPSSADGLDGCPDERLRLRSLAPVDCPFGSKIGTVEAETPVLNERLTGGIYLRTQNSNDPESGEMFRIALVLENEERGLSIRLPGQIRVNDATGRIEAVFEANPQLPVSRISLHFKSGPRAPLATPMTCGPKQTSAILTSWAGQEARLTSTFDSPCVGGQGGFNPSFLAGADVNAGGGLSPLTVRFGRNDGDQFLRDLSLTFPPGITAKIASVPVLCGEAQAAAGTCPESSRIGSVTSGAGAGAPLYLPGRVYLTSSYKGGPFGLSIVVPAVAGPFDLGSVVVRAAIYVDRNDASLDIVSDPLPTILKGVPLRVRLVDVRVDRPNFMVNPTSCDPQRIDARLGSAQGTSVGRSSRSQMASCGALPYRPKLTLSIGDRRHLRAESTTPLTATLTMPRGSQANNQSVEVTLPPNVNSRLSALRGACSVENARARRCGRDAIVGSAVAVTPLLKEPLTGPVYIIRTPGNRLPNLWVALKGQGVGAGIDFDLIGRVRIVGSRLQLRTTFGEVPDVPVTLFQLKFVAGRQAPIGIVRGICSARERRGMIADLRMHAQSGRLATSRQRMSVVGCRRSTRAGSRGPDRTRRGVTQRRSSGKR